ncbi:MAG: ABC transporter permease [Planctomycetota bacterium]|jgi:ABC-type antimicrobial peptide transport system permease subunit|nr:ABC transporter permease [Planctomycetota bacterium]
MMFFRLIPFRYNLRSLGRRRLRTMLTVVGISLVVFVCILMLSFSRGIKSSFSNTASSQNAIIVNANAFTDLTLSRVPKGVADNFAASANGIKEEHGQRLISPEVHLGSNIELSKDSGQFLFGVVRGVRPIAFRVHPQVGITKGREPAPGRKVIVGRLAATKLGIADDAIALGSTLYFEGDAWEVVGFFDAPGTAFESEIWCDVDDLIVSTKREEYSAISVVLESPEGFEDVDYFCKSRLNLELQAWKESVFYSRLAETLDPMIYLVGIMVVMVTGGGILAGMNTMYAAVLGRFQEFGILRLMGFSRLSILTGLCCESMLIAGTGGMLGAIFAEMIGGFSLRFPMGAFSLTVELEILLIGILQALFIGLAGGLLPGIRSIRMSQVDSIRAL